MATPLQLISGSQGIPNKEGGQTKTTCVLWKKNMATYQAFDLVR